MKIVTVVPFEKGPYKEDLSYFSAKEIPDGSIVEVTLRNKKLLGLAVASVDASAAKGEIKELDFNLKKILEVKENSIIKKKFIDAVLSISRYFASRKNDGIASLIPAMLKDN